MKRLLSMRVSHSSSSWLEGVGEKSFVPSSLLLKLLLLFDLWAVAVSYGKGEEEFFVCLVLVSQEEA